MTERKPKEPPILNPRYAGATPAMVGLALLRREPEPDDRTAPDDESSPVIAEPAPR